MPVCVCILFSLEKSNFKTKGENYFTMEYCAFTAQPLILAHIP
jgi:hypothetical protein